MNKIEEKRVAKEEISGFHKKMQNGTAKEEISGCHKKGKTGQRTKSKRNGKKTVNGSPKIWAKKRQKGKKARAH